MVALFGAGEGVPRKANIIKYELNSSRTPIWFRSGNGSPFRLEHYSRCCVYEDPTVSSTMTYFNEPVCAEQ
jgi:hypothetical protein